MKRQRSRLAKIDEIFGKGAFLCRKVKKEDIEGGENSEEESAEYESY
ncbi:MAG: hypothetical protein IJ744_08245 [Lachnospiraceae bacterium]|nr:hypothetical protein [Lachnospiraceae bacterium]